MFDYEALEAAFNYLKFAERSNYYALVRMFRKIMKLNFAFLAWYRTTFHTKVSFCLSGADDFINGDPVVLFSWGGCRHNMVVTLFVRC